MTESTKQERRKGLAKLPIEGSNLLFRRKHLRSTMKLVLSSMAEYNGTEQLPSQEEIWRDCERYHETNTRLKAIEKFQLTTPTGKANHRRIVNNLYHALVDLEAKYPFIQPPLSQQWSESLLSRYIQRRKIT